MNSSLIKKKLNNLAQIILNFPSQFRIGIKRAKKVKIKKKFKGLIICAMGGSALPGEVLKIWLEARRIKLPLFFQRNYGLPYFVDKNYLVISLSYSGNTEETLAGFEEARQKRISLAVITSGGKLGKMTRKYRIPLAKIPPGFPPRMALGFQFAALMKILANCQMIEDDLKDIIALEGELKPQKLRKEGKNLAKKLIGKIPFIWASDEFKTLARIWKINFNENSKILAFADCFPELNHNTLSGLENPQGKFHVIILRQPAPHPQNLKRMKLTADFLKARKIPLDWVEIKGKDVLTQIFSNLLLGSWVSYYLALNYGRDPLSVEWQEKFKKKLKEEE